MAKIANKVDGEGFVRFEFADGEFLQCNVDDLTNPKTQQDLMLHGIKQKVGDSYAGAESVKEARGMAEAVWRNLKAGVWAAKVQRGGKIVEALHRLTGQPFEVCLEKWAGMDDAQQKGLRKHADIKRVLAEMELERANALAQVAGEGDDLSALF